MNYLQAKLANSAQKTHEKTCISAGFGGADDQIRTGDLILTKGQMFNFSNIAACPTGPKKLLVIRLFKAVNITFYHMLCQSNCLPDLKLSKCHDVLFFEHLSKMNKF